MCKCKEKMVPGFKVSTTKTRGFWMTFANGYRISVQFGYGNYCDNQDWSGETWDAVPDYWESPNAEVAVFNPSGEFVDLHDYDQVIGHQSPEEVLRIMTWAANQGMVPTREGEVTGWFGIPDEEPSEEVSA